jgi:hypothetical protein
MYNFDGLSIHDIVSVFFHVWIVRVPFFEVNVNVIVTHSFCRGGRGGGGRGGSFPFWKNEFFRFDHYFMNIA